MAGRLDGKVCVITGAGGGMGADAAQLFTEEGAKVVVADVNVEAATTVAESVDGLAVQVDVADPDSVQAMYRARRRAFRRHRRALQQRRDLACRRRLDPRHGSRRVGARAGGEHARRVPLLQVRHPVPAASVAAAP